MNNSIDLLQARDFACHLGQLAAEQLQRGREQAHRIIEKVPGDWSSDLDLQIETLLRERIASHYSDHLFWGEESSSVAPASALLQDRHVWVVDPIDGSMNFLRGYPQYAVSIALLQSGIPVVACIVDPVRQETYLAARGHGAHCNGQPLKVATTALLSQAVAATVFPKPGSDFMPQYLHELGLTMRTASGVRRAGSMALELAYLAAGRIDVFWERGMSAWDAAAGMLLIEEAGGQLWALDGLPWHTSGALAASTPALQSAWRALLHTAPA